MVLWTAPESISLILYRTKGPGLTALHSVEPVDLFRHTLVVRVPGISGTTWILPRQLAARGTNEHARLRWPFLQKIV